MTETKQPWERHTCTHHECQTPAQWHKMEQGMPTKDRRCQEHGPVGSEKHRRDAHGHRIWKRC